MPLTNSKVMGEVADRYDLIGMDPRFVGRSTPLDCGWNLGSAPLRSAGANRAAYRKEVAVARDLAGRCKRAHGAALPYVTTRNTARDMDVIRAALGEDALSYLGYSYGSYLGEVYTQLFPGRTDRMVLDGVMPPERYSPTLLHGAEAANEGALREWASWAAVRHGTYGLGATRGLVLATVRRILDAATQKPLRLGEEYLLDEHALPGVLIGGLGSDLGPPARQPGRDRTAAGTRSGPRAGRAVRSARQAAGVPADRGRLGLRRPDDRDRLRRRSRAARRRQLLARGPGLPRAVPPRRAAGQQHHPPASSGTGPPRRRPCSTTTSRPCSWPPPVTPAPSTPVPRPCASSGPATGCSL